MRIAIIGNGFSGATLPLAQHLNECGYNVDCYYLVFEGAEFIESLDFDYKATGNKVIKIKKSNTIYNYLDQSININLLPNYSVNRKSKLLLIGYYRLLQNKRRMKRYAEHIISQGYDKIYVIVHTDYEVQICRYLQEAHVPFFIGYHEVLKSHLSNRTLKREVEDSIQFGTKIVVHSEQTKKDILDNTDVLNLENRIAVIPFGPFESYRAYQIKDIPNVPDDYFLYLGFISPHKGLKILYEAFANDERLKDCKIVVAGRGRDDTLELMRKDSHFTLLHKYVKNDELCSLMAKCKAVICPYLSASQSGLVQTAVVFGKPVIATDVGAFREIIINGVNGYIVKPGSSKDLANGIVAFLSSSLGNLNEKNLAPKFHWDVIVDKYKNNQFL